MKKTIRLLLVVVMATAMVTIVGCEEEGDPVVVNNSGNNGNNGGGGGGGGNGNDIDTAEWVDLGLPSGLLWASRNVGAINLEDYGDYFAWGETQPKSNYSWRTYRYCTVDAEGKLATLTKYNIGTLYGSVDSLTTLQPEDDAATVLLGNGARTPTREEWQELFDNTTVEWTILNGVDGKKLTATNGRSIFLPAAGYRDGSEFKDECYVRYWSGTLAGRQSDDAYCSYGSSGVWTLGWHRCLGKSVRAVRDRQK